MYRNPYYEPYLKADELEHYGVKGMRWGVRKEEDKSSGNRSTSKSSNSMSNHAKKNDKKGHSFNKSAAKNSSGREYITYQMSNDQLREGWYRFEDIAKENGGLNETGYAKAAEEFNPLERALLIVWQQVLLAGLQNRVTVTLAGYSDADRPDIKLQDNQTGALYSSVDDCLAALNKEKQANAGTRPRGRERNVDQNSKPVSVSKGERIDSSVPMTSLVDRVKRETEFYNAAIEKKNAAFRASLRQNNTEKEKNPAAEKGERAVSNVLKSLNRKQTKTKAKKRS